MLIFAIILSFLICIEAADDAGIELVSCNVNNAAGMKKPQPPPNSCTDANPNLCAALLSPALEAAVLGTNLNDGQHFKVHTKCYDAALKNVIETNCRSSCAMCCKAPEFNCPDTGDAGTCAVFKQTKALCNSNFTISIAKAKCPSTCAICNNRFVCPNRDDYCELLKAGGLLDCSTANMKEGCAGSCGLDTCLTAPATPKPACSDEASDCAIVKALNYCSKANAYGNAVTARCRQTCGVCK